MTNYEKTKIAIHYRMLGAGMFNAVRAMNFAITYHTGRRKDGDPEFSHQIFIANFAITLPIYDKEVMETLLCVIFLHDICEDYDVTFEEIGEKFGKNVMYIVKHLTKIIGGKKLSEDEYMDNIRKEPIAMLAKGCDRLHNVSTMVKAFSDEKIREYIKETLEHILSMIKYGRKNYPEYELAFENIKQSITGRLAIIQAFTESPEEVENT